MKNGKFMPYIYIYNILAKWKVSNNQIIYADFEDHCLTTKACLKQIHIHLYNLSVYIKTFDLRWDVNVK